MADLSSSWARGASGRRRHRSRSTAGRPTPSSPTSSARPTSCRRDGRRRRRVGRRGRHPRACRLPEGVDARHRLGPAGGRSRRRRRMQAPHARARQLRARPRRAASRPSSMPAAPRSSPSPRRATGRALHGGDAVGRAHPGGACVVLRHEARAARGPLADYAPLAFPAIMLIVFFVVPFGIMLAVSFFRARAGRASTSRTSSSTIMRASSRRSSPSVLGFSLFLAALRRRRLRRARPSLHLQLDAMRRSAAGRLAGRRCWRSCRCRRSSSASPGRRSSRAPPASPISSSRSA